MISFTSYHCVFKNNHDEFVNNINEFILLCICYSMFLFSEWVPEKEQQYDLGYSFIFGVTGMLLFNSSFVVTGILRMMRLNAIKYFKRLRRRC